MAAVLALPREAGTVEAAEARGLLAAHLRELGYEVETQPFAFAPGALNAFPFLGAGLGWLAVLTIPLLLMPAVPNWAALAVWLAGLVTLGLLVRGVALGWSVGGAGGENREDANLIARRPGGAPVRRWIVAHTDTKSQGHSMAGRLVAVWVVLAAILTQTTLAALRLGGALPAAAVAGAGALTLVAGALAGRGRLKGVTTGALDNGSGLFAALVAAETSRDPAIGIILTGAEEFGLVGARILGQTRRELLQDVEVVNIDTVDERGNLSIVSHDDRGRRLAESLEGGLTTPDVSVRLRRLPLGIFVDSHPLARAGAAAVTIGRLDWTTLRLIHTPRDTIDGCSFATARRVGLAVAN